MGFFDMFKKKETQIVLGAPMAGRCVSIHEVPDPTFGEEILGKGMAIQPSDGRVVAPADGEISTVFPTGHAVGLTTAEGTEILIHIGLDTVELKGEPFQIKVEANQKVKKGDLLIVADLEKIKAAGKNVITPMIVCNSDAYAKVEALTDRDVQPGDDVLKLDK